jgi:hypothetical protein
MWLESGDGGVLAGSISMHWQHCAQAMPRARGKGDYGDGHETVD